MNGSEIKSNIRDELTMNNCTETVPGHVCCSFFSPNVFTEYPKKRVIVKGEGVQFGKLLIPLVTLDGF